MTKIYKVILCNGSEYTFSDSEYNCNFVLDEFVAVSKKQGKSYRFIGNYTVLIEDEDEVKKA